MVVGIIFVVLWGVVGKLLCVNEAVLWAEGVLPVPWTHHDWNEAIGYVHLDPIEYWPRRKGLFKNDDTTCPTKQDNLSDLKKKASRMDSMALLPTRYRLKGRLNHNTTMHMPVLLQVRKLHVSCIIGHARRCTCWIRQREATSNPPVCIHMWCDVKPAVWIFASNDGNFSTQNNASSRMFLISWGTRMVHYEFAMLFDGIRACNDVFDGGY